MEDARHAPVSLRARGLPLARSAGFVVVVIVVAVVAWRLPPAISTVGDRASELAAMPETQRDLLGARAADVDTRIFIEARRRIALGETYAVVTGPNVAVSTPSTRSAIAPFARYYLLPRRQTPEPTVANWIISFGGDLDSIDVHYAERYAIAPGIELARVAR